MAIITGTAIAGATIGAGTIAAGAGFALSAAGTTKSFIDAGKARRDAQAASNKATKAFEEAEKKLDVNYLKGLSIKKEPYELAREAGLSGAAQILQAGREGELRGAVSTAGRAQLLNQQQQNQIRMAMGQEAQKIQRDAANEDLRLAGAKADLKLKQATGFESQAADARAREQALKQAGAQGVVSLGTQALKAAPLYPSAKDVTQLPYSGALIDNKAIDAQILKPNNPIFGVDSQFIFDPASLSRPGFLDGVSIIEDNEPRTCLLYTSPSPRDRTRSRMPSSA